MKRRSETLEWGWVTKKLIICFLLFVADSTWSTVNLKTNESFCFWPKCPRQVPKFDFPVVLFMISWVNHYYLESLLLQTKLQMWVSLRLVAELSGTLSSLIEIPLDCLPHCCSSIIKIPKMITNSLIPRVSTLPNPCWEVREESRPWLGDWSCVSHNLGDYE